MRAYFIYKATNKINGMAYVGQSVHPFERIQQHATDRRNKNSIFHRAIDKYGIDAFKWEWLAVARDKDEANEAERYYIEKEKTYKPNGYNMTKGGDGGSMWNAIPVVCLTLDGQFVKRYDSATEAQADGFWCGNVIRCCKDKTKFCKNHIFMFEDEYLRTGGRKWKKPMPRCTKPIIQCDLEGNFIKRFDSITDIENELGISHTNVVMCARGKQKSASGYIFVYEKDFPIKDVESRQKRKKGRKVAKVDKNTGEILEVYDRMTDAARELGGSHKMIHKVLDDPNKTAYGFKWISQ